MIKTIKQTYMCQIIVKEYIKQSLLEVVEKYKT